MTVCPFSFLLISKKITIFQSVKNFDRQIDSQTKFMEKLSPAVTRALLSISGAIILSAAAAAQDTGKTVYMAANAHLDTQWNWTVQQTIGEFLPNTLKQNFALLEAFPAYKFSFEGAVKYSWFKEYYPEEFEKLKEYVAQGRWYPSGGWDANDWNVPSAESNIRNILLGEEFYKREFGRKSIDIMLPDCFGFGYTLPSIAAHCGLYAFHTQKLKWRTNPFYEGGGKWPFEFGIWQGIDGSRILAAPNGSNYSWDPNGPITEDAELIGKLEASPIPGVLRYYGTRSSRLGGDRGGSPTPQAVRFIDGSIKAGSPHYNLRFATVADIFEDHKDLLGKDILPVYDGELLMDVHGSGVYTANSDNKMFNRRCEQLGYAAEVSASAASWLGAVPYPSYVLNDAWRRFIVHQFHDDLTGTSIPAAYTFSWNDYTLAQNQFSNTMEASAAGISGALDTRTKGIPAVVFNPVAASNPEPVFAEIELPEGYEGIEVYGPDGKKCKSQILSKEGRKANIVFAAASPSASFAVYDIRPVKRQASRSSALKVSGHSMENRIYKLSVGESGDIISIVDKRCGRELVAPGKAFWLQVLKENTSDRWPAWEILKTTIDKEPEKVDKDVRISIESEGPLMAVLRIDRKYEESCFTQRIILYDGAVDERIDVRNDVDWRSRRSLLKTAFPVSFTASEASYDLGLGHIKRGSNTLTAYEVPAQQWADITADDGSYGITILNDGRYGWDKPDNVTLRLTLLHSPTADNHYKAQSDLDIAPHTFTWSIIGHQGDKGPGAVASLQADILNQRKSAYAVSDKHSGKLGKSFSLLESSNPAIRIRAVKQAEDGDGLIVRVYELSGAPAKGSLNFASSIVSAEETNGIEERIGTAQWSGNKLLVELKRFAPKTFRIRLAAPAKACRAPEMQAVALPFNKLAISSNAFSAFGRMDAGWHSYAAEQIPETILYKGVCFKTGEADINNAVACKGQAISLPEGTRGVYLLAASSGEDAVCADFDAGQPASLEVPAWSGFFGGGNYGPYKAFLRCGEVAYIGSHRHDASLRDEPYVQTYMYMLYVPVAEGCTMLTLPDEERITVFAATAVSGGRPCAIEISDSVTRLVRQ